MLSSKWGAINSKFVNWSKSVVSTESSLFIWLVEAINSVVKNIRWSKMFCPLVSPLHCNLNHLWPTNIWLCINILQQSVQVAKRAVKVVHLSSINSHLNLCRHTQVAHNEHAKDLIQNSDGSVLDQNLNSGSRSFLSRVSHLQWCLVPCLLSPQLALLSIN